jgi:cytochrome c553
VHTRVRPCYVSVMTYPFFAPPGTRLRAFVQRRIAATLAMVLAALATGNSVKAEEPANYALGRHLATECTTCHGARGGEQGAIPRIAGRPEAELIAALKAYAAGSAPDGHPASPTMVSVAQSLDEVQMAAVAGYLATLPPARPTR